MRRYLPSLNQLKAFEATARHLSFSDAAKELNVTHAAVSHQVKALEDFLQCRLFVRQTRSIQLTDRGRALFAESRKALDIIDSATGKFFDDRLDGTLTISVVPSFANRWMLPRLSAFRELYPSLNVDVRPEIELSQLPENQVDVAVRHGHGYWSELTSECLFREELIPVASPGFAKSMTEASFWMEPLLGATPRREEWHDWVRRYTGGSVSELSILLYPSQALALDAAVGGSGIALADRRIVQRDIESGRLVVVQDTPILSENGYFLCYLSGRSSQRKIIVFRDWLREALLSAGLEHQ